MSPPQDQEFEVLLRVLQRTGDEQGALARIDAIARSDPDWNRVLRLAIRHGLTYPLREALREIESAPPEQTLQRLASIHEGHSLQNLQHVAQLHELVEEFRNRNIRVLPYKGPVVAQTAYGDVNRRQFGDIDFLMHEDGIEPAREILHARGYEQTNFTDVPVATLLNDSVFWWGREFRFVNGSDTIPIELRPQFISASRPSAEIFTELWGRRTSVSLAGQSVSILSPEDHALMLLIHGTRHTWHRLSWIYDVSLLLKQDIDWELVLERAAQSGWTTAVLLGLAVVAEMSCVSLPPEITQELSDNTRASRGSRFVIDRVSSDRTPEAVDLEPWTNVLFLYDDPYKAVAEFANIVFSPRNSDYDRIDLPPRLFPLYYFVHLLRSPEKVYNHVAGWGVSDTTDHKN